MAKTIKNISECRKLIKKANESVKKISERRSKNEAEKHIVSDLMKDLDLTDIQTELASYDSGYITDDISEIADNNVDIYHSDLFDWARDNWSYIDDACQEFGMPDSKDSRIVIKLIQQGQYLANEQEIYDNLDSVLLYYCYNYVLDTLGIKEITDEQKEAIKEKCTDVDNNDKLEDYNDFLDELFENNN